MPLSSDFDGTGRFQILRRLGAGGMGVVYEAFDRDRKTHVALKTLKNLDANGILAFKKEFRALQGFQHPNLVGLGDLIEERGHWFFTMELVRGTDFLSYVRPAGRAREDEPTSPLSDSAPYARIVGQEGRAGIPRLDEARLRATLLQLARALHSLHEANKIHRDIKPSNILVTPEGRVVLLDFGLVTELGSSVSADGALVGTVAYMAPEQAAWKPFGPAADWYSVGVLLYFALTAQLPFDGHAAQILMRKQREPPAPPPAITPTRFVDLEELCLELLRIEPDQRPPGKDVLRRLAGGSARETTKPTLPPAPMSGEPFVGRDTELSALFAALGEARRGRSIVACIHGEPGVGKSALLRRFLSLAAEGEHSITLAGRCYEREFLPFEALDGAIDALSVVLARLPDDQVHALLPRQAYLLPQLFPVLGRVAGLSDGAPSGVVSVEPQELRARSFAAMRELFAQVAAYRPIIVAVDDWQWADADSQALLAEILREPLRMLLVCTTREAPGEREGHGGWPAAVVRNVMLDRLRPAEAVALAEDLVRRGAPAADAPLIAKLADGHPLFIDELVRHARRVGGRGDADVEEALASRVLELPPRAREILALVSVAAAPIPVAAVARSVLPEASGRELASLERQLAELRAKSLVRSAGQKGDDALEPYHERVRRAVVSRLSADELVHHHDRLATALGETGGAAEVLMHHLERAGRLGEAAEQAKRAAAQAVRALAFDRACTLHRAALDLATRAGTEGGALRDLRAAYGDALASAGRGLEAADVYLAAAVGAAPDLSLDLRRRAADQLLRMGHIDRGLLVLGEVLEARRLKMARTPAGAVASLLFERGRLLTRGQAFATRTEAEVPREELARVDLAWSVTVGLSLVDLVRAADFQARTMRFALDCGEPRRLARAFAMSAAFAAFEGRRARRRAERQLSLAEELARHTGDPYALAWVPLSRGTIAFAEGAFRRAVTELGVAEARFREYGRGVSWELATTRTYTLWALGYTGDLAQLGLHVEAGLREARARGDRFAEVHMRTGASHYVRLAADDPASSRNESREALAEWSHAGFHLQHLLDLFVQVETDLYEGDAERAASRLAKAWPALEAAMFLRLENTRIFLPDLAARVDLARAAEDRLLSSRARDLLVSVEKRARRILELESTWGTPMARTLLAGVARVRADRRTARDLLVEACRGFEAAEMRLAHAAASRRLGEILGGDEGRDRIARADAWLASQGVKNAPRLVAMLTPGFDR